MTLQPDGKVVAAGTEDNGISYNANSTTARFLNSLLTPKVVNPTLHYADFDGDSKSDVSVFRNGTWFINPSGSPTGFAPDAPSAAYSIQFGKSSDIMVSADYDGDGKADIAVFRPPNDSWYLQQ